MEINKNTKETLHRSLLLFYDALKFGDLKSLSHLMTRESYMITLQSLGFKRAFREADFQTLLKNIENDAQSLKSVETMLCADLLNNSREHQLEITSFEPKGTNRITLGYAQDGYSKKMYFSKFNEEWKIDYKAGRKK
ncbi:hypothetical protein KKG72_09435 [bacterium]|nr:hypothetical protein [bacterium]MBU1993106.1 hypothetical protein [bacterium]